MNKKKILFLTGTRADFGKLKPLMHAIDDSDCFECFIFATGMHVLSRYGLTIKEVYKSGFKNIYKFINYMHGESMEFILANTINGLSRYIDEYMPDMIVVHGDRVETLAGAVVGAFRNILVAHIEGGEVSGTIDELIRHSVTKLSHVHFVANGLAANRLRQLGENDRSIYIIGSPDIDVMLSKNLPAIDTVKDYYEIPFDEYGVLLFHSVTTELEGQRDRVEALVSALLHTNHNFVVIYPNNDQGSEDIFSAYKRLETNSRFKIFPSMRFEYFLSLIKHSRYIIGNSSAGVREAPVYAVPSINIGTRQKNRFCHSSVINAGYEKESIIEAISKVDTIDGLKPCYHFGDGNSVNCFMDALNSNELWQTPKQKEFCDILNNSHVEKAR